MRRGPAGRAHLARARRAQRAARSLDLPDHRGVRRRLLRGLPRPRASRARRADGRPAAPARGAHESGAAQVGRKAMPDTALIVVDMLNTYDHEDAEPLVDSVKDALPNMVAL